MQLPSFVYAILATAAWHPLADEECAMIQVKNRRKDDNSTRLWAELVGEGEQAALSCAEGAACGLVTGAMKARKSNEFLTAGVNYGCMTRMSKMGENFSKGIALASKKAQKDAYMPCALKKISEHGAPAVRACSKALGERIQANCLKLQGFQLRMMCQFHAPNKTKAETEKVCGSKVSLAAALKSCGYPNSTNWLEKHSTDVKGLAEMGCSMAGSILFDKLIKKVFTKKAAEEEKADMEKESEKAATEESEEAQEEAEGKITKEEVETEETDQEEELDKEAEAEETTADDADTAEDVVDE
jgi:uncharacterized protein (UPF0248 family)